MARLEIEEEQARIDAFAADARESLARLGQEIDRELARLGARIRDAGGDLAAPAPRAFDADRDLRLGSTLDYGIAGTIGEIARGDVTGRSLARTGLRLAGRSLGGALAGALGGGGWRLSTLQAAAEQFRFLGRSRRDG